MCYRVNGTFNGLVLLEADTESHARMRAELDDLTPGGDCQSYEIGPVEAATIPSEFVVRPLGRDEVTELEKVVLANTPKKPPASSMTNDNSAERGDLGGFSHGSSPQSRCASPCAGQNGNITFKPGWGRRSNHGLCD